MPTPMSAIEELSSADESPEDFERRLEREAVAERERIAGLGDGAPL